MSNTVSKELAQRLVDAGVVVETEKVYLFHSGTGTKLIWRDMLDTNFGKFTSAPNSDELLAVLPRTLPCLECGEQILDVWNLELGISKGGYGVSYRDDEHEILHNIFIHNESLPEALGNLALKLAEAGLLEVVK